MTLVLCRVFLIKCTSLNVNVMYKIFFLFEIKKTTIHVITKIRPFIINLKNMNIKCCKNYKDCKLIINYRFPLSLQIIFSQIQTSHSMQLIILVINVSFVNLKVFYIVSKKKTSK